VFKIVIFIIMCGLIWELIDRINNAEQWSKEEREILEKQGKPPLKYPEGYLRNEERKSATNSIKFDIFLDFYSNMEHKEKYIQSYVDYKGKRTYIVFYDWKQEPLNQLANYIYRKGELCLPKKIRNFLEVKSGIRNNERY